MMLKRIIGACSVSMVLAAAAWAQVPAGAEFQVNTYTTTFQYTPSVASDADGNFVAVWSSNGQDGSGTGVFGQRFSAAGARLGAEVQVNTYTTSVQYTPSVASDADGNFVVAWSSIGQDGSGTGVFGQRFSAAGAPLGTEFRVNTFTTNEQDFPSVALDASGNFVVAWSSYGQDGSYFGIFGQRFSAAGAPLGTEFQVNTFTTNHQASSSVASDASGNFVVAWSRQDGNLFGVFGQRFSAAGAPLGNEFQVNTFTTGHQVSPSVASDASGNFVVAWQSGGQDGSSYGVFGQRFSAAGTPLGTEFQVNTFTTNSQASPSVASDASGNFVVAWSSDGQDGSNSGVFGQRFGGLHPAALAVDTVATPNADGNGVLEPGETVDVRPSWRNFNGAAQTFSGTLSDISGPAGATYVITDATGDYGTVANGATGQCADCYEVSVSNPATRPATHWDASAVESILPDVQGQQKQWLLHVGDSFTDVPRTNGFYRFVETLLHHAVTGGCTTTTYCPLSATTREQMAVFVLVAKEGASYAPAACVPGAETFADVPASSGFCPWIEELARRGIVAGCGGGNYCPTSPVTREEMAVFVLRTLDPALNPPACVPPNLFADVPETSGFCRWIEELANRNIVTGCGGGNYCPASPVTREQMGVFISATFGLTLYGP